MSGVRLLSREAMVWAVGIEDTFIGQPIRHSGQALDEYELTQHYRFWRDDLDRAASLGVTAIRYGIPWYRVNPGPGQFDWSWVDEAVEYAARDKGLTVIADLVHYGVPAWVPDSFTDPAYPAAVAAFAGTFAARYRGLVRFYTPLNEPTITAQFCGQRGLWPPYLTGNDGWVRVVLGVIAGIKKSIDAIRSNDPDAVVVHVEAAKVVERSDETSQQVARQVEERNYLPTDLLLGRVSPAHELYGWLRQHGASEDALRQLADSPPAVDMIGVNYYPEISVRHLVQYRGLATEVAVDGWTTGLRAALRGFADRYGLPVLLSETSTDGDDRRRSEWLRDSADCVELLRGEGVDIRAFTWWPLFDFIDWSHSLGSERLEEFLVRVPDGDGGWHLAVPIQPSDSGEGTLDTYLRRMGLWSLHLETDGTLARVESATAREFRTAAGSRGR